MTEKKNINYPYGLLNQVQDTKFYKRIEVNNGDPFGPIRETVAESYKQNIKPDGNYIGVVLYVSDIEQTFSSIARIWEFISPSTAPPVVRTAKVRVPEIHATIPEPIDSEDSLSISMHDSFEYVEQDILIGEKLEVGDLVEVTFYDGQNRFRPKIIKKVGAKLPENITNPGAYGAYGQGFPYNPSSAGKGKYKSAIIIGPRSLEVNPAEQSFIDSNKNYILCNSQPVEIGWPKVEVRKLRAPYRDEGGSYEYVDPNKPRIIDLICVHYDDGWGEKNYINSETREVRKEFDHPYHFIVGNDGYIYQVLDPHDIGWASAGKKWAKNEQGKTVKTRVGNNINYRCIGVCISNYYSGYKNLHKTKKRYLEFFGRERPTKVIKVPHSNKTKEVPVPYPDQVEAFTYLLSVLCTHYNIPFIAPTNELGEEYNGIYEPVVTDQFQGVCAHFHNSVNRVDPKGVDLVEAVRNAEKLAYSGANSSNYARANPYGSMF